MKRQDDAPYWNAIRSYKAYLISGYLLRHRTQAAAAEALGISAIHLRKEIKMLKSYGLMQGDTEPQESAKAGGDDTSADTVPSGGDTE